MEEELISKLSLWEQQPAKPVRTLEALIDCYKEGHRNFSGSDLRGVTVNTIQLIEEEMNYLNLREIILRGSNLTAIVLYRYSSGYLAVDLTGADLSNCNLQGANLSKCRIDRCNFSYSNLKKACLNETSCRGTDFISSKLQSISGTTDCTASNFTGANLKSSFLSGTFNYANFCGSNLQKASFKYFNSSEADFSNADLREVGLPAPTTVSLQYSYYNHKTKFSGEIDPIGMGMELLEDDINSEV